MQTVVFEDLKRNTAINQLKKLYLAEINRMSEEELKHELAYRKAKRVKIDCSENKYF